MADEPLSTQEDTAGLIRMGCSSLLVLALPFWLMLTATVIQLTPELHETTLVIEDDLLVITEPTLLGWIVQGGGVAGLGVALILSVIGLVLATAEQVGRWRARTERRQRALDDERHAARIEGGEWVVERPDRPDGDDPGRRIG